MTRVLLTGAGGFVGSHVLAHIMTNTTWDVVATDSFRHEGKTDRLVQMTDARPEWRARLNVITHDLAAPFTAAMEHRIGKIDYVIAMASLSNVDHSIEDPVPFVTNNTMLALNTLEFCRHIQPRAVLWVSTDEVYGPQINEPHREWAPILPSNPYAASKAAQEAIAISYWRTYGVPLILTNTMNMIGEMQGPGKFLPLLIKWVLLGEVAQIHGRPRDVGSRHYLHARNAADGWLFILRNHPPAAFVEGAERPDRYNVVGPDRISNLRLAQMVAEVLDQPLKYRLVDFHSARPGHDPHYGLDGSLLSSLGWTPPKPFFESLAKTVRWTIEHPEWME